MFGETKNPIFKLINYGPSTGGSKSNQKKVVHLTIPDEITSSSLSNLLKPEDFTWIISGGTPWVYEVRNYYLLGDGGDVMMVQVSHGNISWPKTNCQMSVRYFNPKVAAEDETGLRYGFVTNGGSASRMELSENNLNLTIAPSSINILNDETLGKHGVHRMNLAISNHQSSPAENAELELKLDFIPCSEAVRLNEGTIHFGSKKDDGYMDIKFIPAARFHGKLKVEGREIDVSGQGYCFHIYQGIKPHAATKKWSIAYFLENPSIEADSTSRSCPRRSLIMIKIYCTETYHNETIQMGFYFNGEQLQAITASDENKLLYSTTEVDPKSGYHVPTNYDYQWKGIDYAGNPFSASIVGNSVHEFAHDDMFQNIPFMIRGLLQVIMHTRPNAYQNFENDIEATINGEIVKGNLMHQHNFLVTED